MNYYNEFDPNAAAWLRQLIEDGIIPKGHVDERSIVEVTPSDLKGYVQCHWFAGISGWPLALKLAGWPEDRPVWTASLPCQSFSSAGKQRGTADERHLWPVFERLVRECRPPVLFGEQVASKLARTDWLPGVCLDLQNMGYSATAFDICAPCAGEVGEGRIVRGDQETWEPIILGAPHIRQRLYWVACRMDNAPSGGSQGSLCGEIRPEREDRSGEESATPRPSASERMADTHIVDDDRAGSRAGDDSGQQRGAEELRGEHGVSDDRMADTDGFGRSHEQQPQVFGAEPAPERGVSERMADPTGDRQQRGRQTAEAQEGREQGRDVGGELPGGSEGRTLDNWRRVSFAADCLGGDDDEPGDECSICGLTYAEDCECPGPTHDGYEYAERDGVLYARWVGDTEELRRGEGITESGGLHERDGAQREAGRLAESGGSQRSRLGDTGSEGSQGHAGDVSDRGEPGRQHQEQARPAWAASWADSDTILCADGKARRFKPGIQPLTDVLPRGVVPSGDPGSAEYANATGEARVMRLKGYGNSIQIDTAAMFISTCMEVIPE